MRILSIAILGLMMMPRIACGDVPAEAVSRRTALSVRIGDFVVERSGFSRSLDIPVEVAFERTLNRSGSIKVAGMLEYNNDGAVDLVRLGMSLEYDIRVQDSGLDGPFIGPFLSGAYDLDGTQCQIATGAVAGYQKVFDFGLTLSVSLGVGFRDTLVLPRWAPVDPNAIYEMAIIHAGFGLGYAF